MTDEGPENLILRQLRLIDGKLDRLSDDVADLKSRMTAIEVTMAGLAGQIAVLGTRVDRIEVRLDRIERRLGLIEGATTQ